jgi:hypothetical protein
LATIDRLTRERGALQVDVYIRMYEYSDLLDEYGILEDNVRYCYEQRDALVERVVVASWALLGEREDLGHTFWEERAHALELGRRMKAWYVLARRGGGSLRLGMRGSGCLLVEDLRSVV